MKRQGLMLILSLIFLIGICPLSFGQSDEKAVGLASSLVMVEVKWQGGRPFLKHAYLSRGLMNYDFQNEYLNNAYFGTVISQKGANIAYFATEGPVAERCWDNFDPEAKIRGGCEEITITDATIRIPFLAEAKKIELFDPHGERLLTIEMSQVEKD